MSESLIALATSAYGGSPDKTILTGLWAKVRRSYDSFTLLTAGTDDYSNFTAGEYVAVAEYLVLVAATSVTDNDYVNVGLVKFYETGLKFTTLARFKAAVARGDIYTAGDVVNAGGNVYHYLNDANTDISGLTGWELVAAKATTDGIDTRLIAAETEQSSQGTRITSLEASQTTNTLVAATWTDLSALSGSTDGQGGEVLDTDTGTHLAASATGYDGASVNNAGRYSWNATWSRWVRIGDTGQTGLQNELDIVSARSQFPTDAPAVLQEVKNLKLYGADPTKFYSVRYLFRDDSGTRFNFTISEHTDAAGTGTVDVCKYADFITHSGVEEFSLTEMSSSGITGSIIVDFDALAASFNMTRGSGGTSFAINAVRKSVFASSAARTANLTAAIDANVAPKLATAATVVAYSPGFRVPFSDDMDTDFLRSIIRDLHLYGVDPAHDYIVSEFSSQEFSGTPLTRVFITIRDITDGVDVCLFRIQTSSVITVAAFVATLPATVKLTDYILSTKTSVYAVATIDWSKATDAKNLYTTMAEAGIHKSRTYSDEDIADYLDQDHWDEIIRCGAAETYTTLRAAVESTYSSDKGSEIINGAPICEQSHYHNQVLIDIVDDGTFNATSLYLPDWVSIRGNGEGRTVIVREDTSASPVIQMRLTGKIFDCTILSETASEYAIHADDFNRNVNGGKAQNVRLRQSFKRVNLQAATGHNGWIFGCGISSGQVITFEDVLGEHLDPTATLPAFGFHNTGPTLSTPTIAVSEKPAQVTMRGCSSPDQLGVILSSVEPSAICSLTLIGCNFNLVHQDVSSGNEVLTDTAAERYAWRIGGVHDGPILQTDPSGLIVLGTTAGQTASGDAAPFTFGTTDELGRGDKWIKDGTTKSLGARLGDCSTVNKTLTIGAQSHVFTTDQTSLSNATIISAINGSITANNVAEVDIQLEIFPDTGFSRRMQNSTGSTIVKGTFVKQASASTIAPCGPTDDIMGWVYRDILDGTAGIVVTTKRLADDYITGATSDGKFGLTSSGALDYVAGTKVGFVQSGIINLY